MLGQRIDLHSTHEETEQTANSQELLEGRGIDGGDLQKTKDNHIGDHRPFATPLVTCEAEHSSSYRSQKESKSNGLGDVGLGDLVVLCEFDCLDGQSVKVKGVSSPRSKTNDEEDPVHCSELRHQAKRVDELWRRLPFGRGFSTVIVDDDSLLPLEKIGPRLLGCWPDSLSDWISRLIDCRHDSLSRIVR